VAVSNSLGTLTLDVVANVGAFTGPLDQAARITKKQMKEMGMAVDEFGNYTDKAMKQAAQATKQLDEQFARMAQNVDRELALYGETSRVAKARYDLEHTELVKLDAVKKAAYLEDMRRLDAMDSANAAFREQAAEMAKVNGLYLQHEQAMKREIALYGETSREAKIRYEIEHGALVTATKDKQFKLLLDARALDAMDAEVSATKKQEAAIQQLNSQYVSLQDNMRKELALYGETSREAKLRYDIELGALSKLSSAKQADLLASARALDLKDAEAAKAKQLAAATKQLEAQSDQLTESMLVQLSTYGQVSRAAQLRYRMEHGDLKSLDAARKSSNLQLAEQLDNLDKAAMGSMRGIRGVATGIGYQMQDIAVQLQMGTNPLMVFAQQGSQIASLFGPTGAVAGAVIAIGGAIAGALLPSLFKTGEASEEVSDKISSLVSEMDKLNDAQRRVVQTANDYRIQDKVKEYDELTKSIEAQRAEVDKLNAQQGKTAYRTVSDGGGVSRLVAEGTVDNTERLVDANRKLEEAQANLVSLERELAGLRDPAKLRENLDTMWEEIELIGLAGPALYAKQAAQQGYVDLLAEEFVYAKMVKEEKEARVKADEDAEKTRKDAAKKAAEDEKSRADSIAKTIAGMEREAALYGVTSKAAQMEYDILNNLLKVKGGLEGVEGRRLLQASDTLDALDAQKAAQDDYVAKMKDWVKGENDKVAAVDKIIKGLEKERAELGLNADAYLEMQLRANGATDAQVKYAVSLAQGNREAASNAKNLEEMFKRLDEIGASIWTDMLNGTRSVFDSIKDMFTSMLADMAHQAVTKPIMLNIQQAVSGGGASAGQGLLSGVGMGGVYAAGAIVAVSAINSWNKKQDEKFEKLTAAYRQGVQSTGTLLGMANEKSDSISNAMSNLEGIAGDTLNVNAAMLSALTDIKNGIGQASAIFGRTGVAGPNVSGLGTTTLNSDIVGVGLFGVGYGVSELVGGQLSAFIDGVIGGVSKALYSKSKKVIDSGIGFVGETLADIMASGTVEAFSYASVQTKKKILGVTTSNKVSDQTAALDDALLSQFSLVFESGGAALGEAAKAFGLDFQSYVDKLVIDPQKLSLKDLEGEDLTKEIESFFSATLDNWAGVLTDGSGVLEKFQQVGEGAFETIIRLAGELNTFSQYADLLDLNFNAVGFAAVDATQAISDAAGGFDKLASSLSSYYQNFFTEEERAAKQMEQLTEALAKLGVTQVPTTREAFRDLIEGLDLTVAAEQEMFAALIGLSGAFADLVEDSEAAEDYITGIKSAFSTLERAVAAEREAIEKANQVSIDAITKSLSKHQALASALSSTLDSMTLQSEKYEAQTRRQAQADIIAANAIRRAGGPLPDLDKLAPALEALSRPSVDMFSNFQDYALDFYQTQNALKELEASAGEQVSVDEQMLKNQEDYFDEEMKRLDEVLSYYQRQLDALEGVDNSVISVAQAVSKLAEAFALAGVDVGTPLISMAAPSVTAQPTIVDRPYAGTVATAPVANQSFSDFLLELRGLRQDLFTSQYAIAKNTQQSNNLLQRWEVDGLPPERAEL